MDRDFFLDAGKLMMLMPELPEIHSGGFSRQNWVKSDEYSQFESSLSSLVSLNSPPPKLNLPIMDQFVKENIAGMRNTTSNLAFFTADPGFVERAAKYSSFGGDGISQLGLNSKKLEVPVGSNGSPVTGAGKFGGVSSSSPVGFEESGNSEVTNVKLSSVPGSNANSNDGSSVSDRIPSGELGFKNRKDTSSRKRKGCSSKGVGSSTKKENDVDESKRLKKTEQENSGKIEEETKPPEPPKDYIHVRARRGEATDSHSLAERVRREKISERMKLLQNLVPNCDKVTGKALMLDEIINYVQSLQRQVEFLSMKLATVNPSLDFDTNDLISENVNQPNESLSHQTSTCYQQNPQVVFDGSGPMTQLAHEFTEPFSHSLGFGQDDLQSIVRMGFGENLDLDTSFFYTIHDPTPNMKIEI